MALPLRILARVQWGPAFPGSLSGPALCPQPRKPDGRPSPRGPGAPKPLLAFRPLAVRVWRPARDWLMEVPPVQPTFPHGKQEAGQASASSWN